MLPPFVSIRDWLPRLLAAFALFASAVQAQVPAPLPAPRLDLIVTGEVSSVAVHPDGGQVLVGSFTSINGVPRDGLARLRADGSLDPLWYPRVQWSGGGSPTFVRRRVFALPDGSVLVFGDFIRINGQAFLGCAAKLSADPSPVVIESWRLNANCLPVEVALDDQGWLYFNAMAAIKRARADTGEWDSNWIGLVDSSRPIYDGSGGLILPGQYWLTRISTSTGAVDWQIPNPSPGALVGAWAGAEADSLYLGWSSRAIDKLSLTTGQSAAGWPKHVPLDPHAFAGSSGILFVGGVGRAAALSAATGEMVGNWTVSGTNRAVREILKREDGGVFVAGNFARFGNTSALGLVELTSPTNQPVALTTAERRGNAELLVRQPDGHVVVSGTFDRANGAERLRLLRLTPDGMLDANWMPRVDDWIRRMVVDSQGDIYLAGPFDCIDGYEISDGIAKIDGDTGAVVTSWSAQINGAPPMGLAVDAADRIYVALLSAYPRVVRRLLPDGSSDPGWTPPATLERSFDLHFAGDHVYVNGIDTQNRSVVQRFSVATAAADPDWELVLNSQGYDFALLPTDDGDMLIGGSFDSVNTVPRSRLVRVSSTAPLSIRDWNPAPNGLVTALGTTATGRLFVGGDFSMIGGKARYGVAEIEPSDGSVLDRWIAPLGGGRMALADDRIYFVSNLRGVVAYPLDIGDTIFATPFD